MDLHGDALGKIVGDMDDMESKKMLPNGGGATITITVSPGGDVSSDGGDGGDLPDDHDMAMCGGGCAMHKGGIVGGETLEQLKPDHDALECKGECPAHKDEKSGAMGKGGLSMAAGGQVPAMPVPAEVDDTRLPPFLRKKKVV